MDDIRSIPGHNPDKAAIASSPSISPQWLPSHGFLFSLELMSFIRGIEPLLREELRISMRIHALPLSNPVTKQWHLIGMEWKEQVAWLVPIAITLAAAIAIKYGRGLSRNILCMRFAFTPEKIPGGIAESSLSVAGCTPWTI
jgi:hypothetical protein